LRSSLKQTPGGPPSTFLVFVSPHSLTREIFWEEFVGYFELRTVNTIAATMAIKPPAMLIASSHQNANTTIEMNSIREGAHPMMMVVGSKSEVMSFPFQPVV
jgi:hypothetical protein